MTPPDWIDHEAWDGFCQMRKRIKAPLTDRAIQLAFRELAKLKAQGYDPNEVLDQSTMLCWRGLFPVKGKEPQKPSQDALWLAFRASIRDSRSPDDPVLKRAVTALGGLHRLGGMSSFDLDRLRKDFDSAVRQAGN